MTMIHYLGLHIYIFNLVPKLRSEKFFKSVAQAFQPVPK